MAELNASAWLAAQQESRASDRDSRERERETSKGSHSNVVKKNSKRYFIT